VTAPMIDPRDGPAILAELLRNLPGYTPELTPEDRGAALAALRVIARYRYILNEGLRRAPARSLLALFDMLGLHLLPASPARVPLVFTLAPDARTDVTLPAGSQAAAPPAPVAPSSDPSAAPVAPGEPVVFATERAVTLSRSRLKSLYSLDPGRDEFVDHSTHLVNGFTLFDDLAPTEHALYMGHDSLFAFGGDITLLIGISLERAAAAPIDLRWEYLSDSGWIPLQSLKEDDTTNGLTLSGQLALRRECGPNAKKATFAEHTSFWLRATTRSPVIAGMSALPLVINDLNVRVKFRKIGLLPEAAYADFTKLDVTKDFHPFGLQAAPLSTFYLGSKEVFQRGGAMATISFQIVTAPYTSGTPILAWEYSTADGWETLDITPAPGAVGESSRDAFTFSAVGITTVSFECPRDWAETDVNGDKNLWLRVRLVGGNYGVPIVITPGTAAVAAKVESTLSPPIVKRCTLAFEYVTDPSFLDHCLAFNDFVFADHSEACRWPDQTFAPFHPVAGTSPAAYFGFDAPLPVGLVSLYFEIPTAAASAQSASPFIWEYRDAKGWSELGVLDETAGFRQSGMLQFIGPRDAAATDGLGGSVYRLRARLKQGEAMQPAVVSAVWLNAVWSAHHQRVERELLALSDGNPGQTLRFSRTPVLEGEIIEVREWTGRGSTWRSALPDVPDADLRFDRDPATGLPTAAWVRWHEQPHLYDSTVADRHYVIERATGLLRFGARVPNAGTRIIATYATGGGAAGNVSAHTVRELRTALPYIAGVDNPVAAGGGAGAESTTEMSLRGPQVVRHRDRALSAQDYEWLARGASPEVARTRCQPLRGPDGRAQRGWITVLVAPKSAAPYPSPSPELARRIRQAVARRGPATAALRVEAPDYVAVSVIATLAPEDPSIAAAVEARVRDALNRFLHPLSGGPDGTGWAFGESVHLSQIAAVIEATPGVDYATRIMLAAGDSLYDTSVPVPANRLVAAGNHELTLRIGGD
jgi:uncharacterized phage protein gp47/JayE